MVTREHIPQHPRAALAVVLLMLACILPLAAPATAPAAGDTFTVKKLHTKISLSQLQGEARKVRAQMDQLKTDIAEISRAYEAARQRFADTGRQLAESRLQLSRTLAELDVQRAVVAARAVAMYKSTDMSLIDVLMGSASFAELQSGVQLFDRVARQDRQAEGRLEQLARGARSLERDIERQRRLADAAQRVIDEQRTELADKLAQRRAILEDLTRRIDEMLSAGLPPGLGPVNGSYTQLSWAKALLEKLRVPVTGPNVAAVTAWELAEGGHWHNTAHYNPLNTTQPMPGATSMNSVGVKAYSSWTQGFAATLKTIHNGYYEGILAALRRGDDAQAVADAVADSPWGTNSFDVAGLAG
jgi:peptidoglycan hydrolase CwlO-like protein